MHRDRIVLCSVTLLSGISHRPEMVRVLSDLGCNMQHRSSSNATCLVAVIKEDVDNRTLTFVDLCGRVCRCACMNVVMPITFILVP